MSDSFIFSEDRKYRYLLTRNIGFGDRKIMFLMVNPSTADEIRNDNTVSRCIDFANRWGYGRLFVTNLSPLRATDPKVLKSSGPDPEDVRLKNLDVIVQTGCKCDMIVVAYGIHGKYENRAQYTLEKLRKSGLDNIYCLGITKDGYPRHPLMVRKETELIKYYLDNA